jgi:hypothetical protein
MFELLLLSILILPVTSHYPNAIYRPQANPKNIFTFQANDLETNEGTVFTENDISSLKIQFDYAMNMYSLFTQNYYNKCPTLDDQYCHYNVIDQEHACRELVNENKTMYKMYYYGIYNNELHDYLIDPSGNIIPISKTIQQYEILGAYAIEYHDDELNNSYDLKYKQMTYFHEPPDFYKRMMVYILHNDSNHSVCPYWTIRD